MRQLLTIFIPILIAEIACNSAWIVVSYDERVRANTSLAYFISIAGGAVSGLAWCYMAKSVRQDQMFVANILWDALVSCVFCLLPILLYGLHLNGKTILGAIVAVIGLTIMGA